MSTFARSVARFLKREDGPTAVEYAVMLALIAALCMAAVTALGANANSAFARVGSARQHNSPPGR